MKINKFKCLTALILPFFLISCAGLTSKSLDTEDMTFNSVKSYPVNVASYQYASFAQDNPIVLPKGLDVNPEQAIYGYLAKRFQPSGNIGKLKAYIQSVTIDYNKEESGNAVAAVLTLDEQDIYTITAEIAFEILGTQTIERDVTVLRIKRVIKQSEHLTLAEREAGQFQAVDEMLDDLDIAIRENLLRKFNAL